MVLRPARRDWADAGIKYSAPAYVERALSPNSSKISIAEAEMQIRDLEIRTRGKLIRVAYFDGEGYQFFDDPQIALEAVRGFRPRPCRHTYPELGIRE